MIHFMRDMRVRTDRLNKTQMSIIEGRFEEYVQQFMKRFFPMGDYPTWCVEALNVAGIHLL